MTDTVDQFVLGIGDVLLLAALTCFIVFALIYTYLTAWEDSPLGRLMMQNTLAVILLLSLPSGFEVFDAEYPAFSIARVAIFTFIVFLGIKRIRMLLAAQRAARNKKRDAEPEQAPVRQDSKEMP